MENQILDTQNKYLISMRKANKKYRETHKEKLNEYHKQYYKAHKSDEEYMNKQREKARKCYYKRKEEKQNKLPETQNYQNI